MHIKASLASFFGSIGRLIENKPVYCLAFFVVFFCVFYGLTLDHRGVGGGDEVSFLRNAYHLVHSGVMSDDANREEPVPSTRRAPGYPVFLAGAIRLIPGLLNDDFECVFEFKKGVPQEPEALVWLKRVQAALLLMTALLAAWLVLDLTGKAIPPHLTLWFVGFHPFLGRYANRLYAEVFGAFLITLFSVLLYFGLKKRNILWITLSGGVLGYLTLTFSQWKLVGCVTIVAVAIYILLTRVDWKKLTVGLVLMTTIWVSAFSYWEGRNERLSGHRFLSAGGGTVLQLRSMYDVMPWSAYFASFAYWSRSPVLKGALVNFVDKSYWGDLDRDAQEGVYLRARAHRNQVFAELGLPGEKGAIETNFIVMDEALEVMKAHPVRHLLMTIPIAFRSMMNPTLSVFYIGVYYLFVVAFWRALCRKQWLVAALLSSPFALFCFNWLATHGLPRYSGQAAPLLVVGAVLGFCSSRKELATHRSTVMTASKTIMK